MSGRGEDRQLDRAVIRAQAAQDWEQLQRLWLEQLRFAGFDAHPAAVPVYAEIPDDARRQYPTLTWARAVAVGHGAPKQERIEMRTFLRDAVALHADWQHNRDTDAAVLAGTMWLSSQQVRTADGIGAEEAWNTRNAVAALSEERRQQGDPPSDNTAAVFHAKSAQLALMRADVETAVTEADRAIVLHPGPAGRLSAGVRALALELQGTSTAIGVSLDESRAVPDPPDFLGQASTPALLAEAARAIRVLDRPAATSALRSLESDGGEPGWPLRVALTAAMGAIWDGPEDVLVQLDADFGHNSVLSSEHHFLLGRVALIRVRSLLLCKLNSPADSLGLMRNLSEPWTWVPTSRAQLWSGDLDAAIRTARAGLFADPSTWHSDRVALSVLKAAAMASSPNRDDEEREAAYQRAVTACSRAQSLSALAMLPDFGFRALFDYHDQRGCTGCILCDPVVRSRLFDVPGSGSGNVLVRLTARERDLLPLLATTETVPTIAAQLHLSVGTVRKQVATLRAKFEARTREELIRRARSGGHLE